MLYLMVFVVMCVFLYSFMFLVLTFYMRCVIFACMMNVMNDEKVVCTRCDRNRRLKFMVKRTTRYGKTVWRCRKKSVCATKGRRIRAVS